MSDQIVKGRGIRVAFPHLVEKHASKKHPNSKAKFGIQLLLHKKDNAEIIARIDAATDVLCAEMGWTKNTVKALAYVEADSVVNDAGEALVGYDSKHLSLSAKSDNRPSVFGRDGGVLSSEEITSTVYGGCYCMVSMAIYAAKAYRKICVELRAVVFDREGERFGGGGAPVSDAKSEFGNFLSDEDLL